MAHWTMRSPDPAPAASEAPTGSTARARLAERNARRLAALASAEGLVVAAIAGEQAFGVERVTPPDEGSAAALAALPGVVIWAWPATAPPEEIGRDLAAARAAFGDDTRAVVVLRPGARVLSAPLAGEVGADVEGVDAVPLVRAVGGLDDGELVRGVDVPWSDAAERRAGAAGFVARAPRD